MSDLKVCWCVDSNCGPLASEATALRTEPQPLPELTIQSSLMKLNGGCYFFKKMNFAPILLLNGPSSASFSFIFGLFKEAIKF